MRDTFLESTLIEAAIVEHLAVLKAFSEGEWLARLPLMNIVDPCSGCASTWRRPSLPGVNYVGGRAYRTRIDRA